MRGRINNEYSTLMGGQAHSSPSPSLISPLLAFPAFMSSSPSPTLLPLTSHNQFLNDRPLLVVQWELLLLTTNSQTTYLGHSFFLVATMRGVTPSLSARFTFAAFSRKYSVIMEYPFEAGCHPKVEISC